MKKIKFLSIFLLLNLIFISCNKDEDEINPPTEETPDVDFVFSPEEPKVGETVTFNADPEPGSSEISSWNWDFDDGSTSSDRNSTNVYDEVGEYTIILTATDVAGTSTEVSKSLSISEEGEEAFAATIAWSYSNGTEVENPNDGSSSPAIDDDGDIYYLEGYAGENSTIVAVTDNGDSAQKKWSNNSFEHNLRNAPSIGPDGDIYTAAWLVDAMFRLDSENGDVVWNAPTGSGISNSTAAIDSEGNIYIGSRSEGIYAWDSDGTELWHHESESGSGTPYYASPALSEDESTLYVLMTGGEVWALSTADGSPKWSEPVEVSPGLGSSLSVDKDGTVYATTSTEVVAVSDNGDNGSLKWNVEVEGAADSGVVIGPEGDLYTGASAGLISLNPEDGSQNWIYETFVEESVPAVDINGNVYIGSVDGKFHIVSPVGKALKVFELGDNIVNSPTIADDGSVFVEATENFKIHLYKITVEDSAPADSPWPMKGQNKKNTAHYSL